MSRPAGPRHTAAAFGLRLRWAPVRATVMAWGQMSAGHARSARHSGQASYGTAAPASSASWSTPAPACAVASQTSITFAR